jgi:hypothetical protein
MIVATLRTIGHAARTGGQLLLEILDAPTPDKQDLIAALEEMRRERDAAVTEAETARHSLDAYRADMSETDRKLRAAYAEIEEMAPAAVAYERMKSGRRYFAPEGQLNLIGEYRVFDVAVSIQSLAHDDLPLVPWIEAQS